VIFAFIGQYLVPEDLSRFNPVVLMLDCALYIVQVVHPGENPLGRFRREGLVWQI
jgi:hypothetical protein